MKTLLFFLLAVLFFCCKKWENQGACEVYIEIKDNGHSVDPYAYNLPELNDTLAKHPELRVFKINTDQYGWTAKCSIVYQSIPIIYGAYYLHKRFNDGALYVTGSIPELEGISLTPEIEGSAAVKVAWQNTNFGTRCIRYQLVIFDADRNYQDSINNYRLVWIVSGDSGYPNVTIDATDGKVYAVDDGIRS